MLAAPARAAETVQLAIEAPKPAPELIYNDAQGLTHRFTVENTKLTAVHFWATWCVPCVAELPEVDAAQAAYGAKGFRVLALSLDTGMDKVKAFFAAHHIAHLAANLDDGMRSFRAARFPGLPDTLFLDAQGQEIARAEGPLNWKDPKNAAFIESHLK